MKRMFLILALLGALVAGWVPVMAATLDICHVAARTTEAAAHHAGHDDPSPGHDRMQVHPMACAACFALPAGIAGPEGETLVGELHRLPAARPLLGLAAAPLDPPPRA